jgi:subtilisin family serine protease
MIADVWQGNPTVRFGISGGTSFSAPLVSAGTGNFWSAYPEMTNEEVRQSVLWGFYQPEDYLIDNPDPWDDYWAYRYYYGHGIFNLYDLVTYGLLSKGSRLFKYSHPYPTVPLLHRSLFSTAQWNSVD